MTGRELTQKRITRLQEQLDNIGGRINEQTEAYKQRLTAKHAAKIAAKNAELAVLVEALADTKEVIA